MNYLQSRFMQSAFYACAAVTSCLILGCSFTAPQDSGSERIPLSPNSSSDTPRQSDASDELSRHAHKKSQLQPNILWILTDDQRADSIAAVNRVIRGTSESALGYVESPNIDALAKEGVLFTYAYSQSPGCSPSRYSMATGQYPHRSGRYGFEYAHRGNEHAKPTMPEILRQAGYQTMLSGKSGLRLREWQPEKGERQTPLTYDFEVERYALSKAGFTDWGKNTAYDPETWEPLSTSEHFYYSDGSKKSFLVSENGKSIGAKNPIDEELDIVRSYTRSLKSLILAGESPKPAGETLDGFILKAFTQYLSHPNASYTSVLGDKIEGPDPTKPVMLSLSFGFPHTPVLPPKSFRDRFKTKQYRIPKFSKSDVESLPPQLVKLYKNMKTDDMTSEEKLKTIQDYYAFTAYGDALIGEAIEKFKVFNETSGRPYLIVMSVGDHGWHLGEQGISAKFAPWNTSNHGAMIVVDSSGEYFPKDTVYNDFVEYVDIAPTILAASGLDVENDEKLSHLDGFDLASVVRNPTLKRDYVIGELNQIIGDRAYLRTKRFGFSMKVRPKLGKPGETHAPGEDIHWALNAKAEDVEMALYDLACDPHERQNVAYHKDYADIVAVLRTKTQNIFLGDKRLEIDWQKENVSFESHFASGAHDYRLPKALTEEASCTAGL
ncbi:sulfatase-like hydrolase/transferase [Alteromonas sp. Mac1]|uniref:sulfatase-like hydrolase/transferase n=1 Tax=Alteromonas sp. Mac1 TaxID=1777491 RepID=UPI00077020FF|nr:sulfatase-like hydrolase/transferase [Alteromonas sp. Mac1]AMJ85715.1 sulfatase [Alteromonas sp. Mac1]AMJ89575.1 sulfatase [Alteromonas sp. Mac2]